MIHQESPRELYQRLEAQISPLLRDTLRSELPQIDPAGWWENLVLPSLSSTQAEHVQTEHDFEQFDYPALVCIFYKNWRLLRPRVKMSNHTTNYLFTLKTFRNDVEHQPNLVLDDARRKYFEETARLAIEQLTHSPTVTIERRPNRRFFLLVGALVAVGMIGIAFYWHRDVFTDEETKVVAQQLTKREQELKNLGTWLATPTVNICMSYQRPKDGSWSKYYTVRAQLEKGSFLKETTGDKRFKVDRYYLVQHWKKTDDYTIIPLPDGLTHAPYDEMLLKDTTTRAWKIQAGWDNCRKPHAK